jgi:hypothetical protein
VGGLYGNVPALDALLELGRAEGGAVRLVFNGDFNWFDVDDASFATINTEVLRHVALRGNVETEIAGDDAAAGCGCGYPDWVSDAEVERSNAISERLRDTARRASELRARLAALPMYAVARVADLRVAIVHGDTHSLAGWGYAQERLADPAARETLAADFIEARCRIIASSHTCLPVMIDCHSPEGRCVLTNNGAAGMPNFRDTRFGLVTRLALRASPHVEPLHATRLGDVHIEALPLHYDAQRWEREFLANWPPGTPGHRSYYGRIRRGPSYERSEAVRWSKATAAAPATPSASQPAPAKEGKR